MDNGNKVTHEDAKRIEEETREQGQSKLWYTVRKNRITASRFGSVCKASVRRNLTSLCKDIYEPGMFSSEAVSHGRIYESVARAEFEKVSGKKVLPAGFFVCLNYPFLGASPDGLVEDDGLLEVKCPYAARDEKVDPEFIRYLHRNSDGDIALKKNSDYYYQIQGQLAITKRDLCYFVVYTFNDMFIEKIVFDKEFFESSMLPQLKDFYTTHYRPFVASKL